MPEVSTTTEFPLSRSTARRILREIVEFRSEKLKLTSHARDRMLEREVTRRHIIQVIKSPNNQFTEGPFQTAEGSWNFTLMAVVSGKRVTLVGDLKRCETDPAVYVVTVIAN